MGDFATTVGETLIRKLKGTLVLQTKELKRKRYHASEALRNPATQTRVINYPLKKTCPAAEKKIGVELLV